MKFFLSFLSFFVLVSCSSGEIDSSFAKLRTPRDNDFIKNGGYKIEKQANPFTNIHDKNSSNIGSVKPELRDVPQTPNTLQNYNTQSNMVNVYTKKQ